MLQHSSAVGGGIMQGGFSMSIYRVDVRAPFEKQVYHALVLTPRGPMQWCLLKGVSSVDYRATVQQHKGYGFVSIFGYVMQRRLATFVSGIWIPPPIE